LGVGVGQCLENRLGDLQGLVRRVRAAAAQALRERLALDERHHVINETLTVAGEVDREDGGVLQPGERLRLLPEPRQHARGPGDLRVEHFACEAARSEEHTSELQSPDHLVCRLLLEKNKITNTVCCRSWTRWSAGWPS